MQVHFMHRHVQDTVVILEEGTPPPPTVLSMRHAVPLECSEQKVPCHHPVRQGGGAEDKALSEISRSFRGILTEYRIPLKQLF